MEALVPGSTMLFNIGLMGTLCKCYTVNDYSELQACYCLLLWVLEVNGVDCI